MDWTDTPEQSRLRDEIRTFIAERFPNGYRPLPGPQSLEPEDVYGYNWPADRRSDDPERREGAMAWAAALAERGWVAPHWPREYGGAGLTVMEELVFAEEFARAGVPMAGGIGVTLLGPTLIEHGTEEQRREHLPKILSGEVVWAQGFSEPESGSDLASLRATAVRDGDDYIVNGQKIWTSHAQYSDWLFALVRTDPDAPKHRGISFLLMDITTPGVTVRPIPDMRGDVPFNEIFLEDVRVPAANLVGEENRGWYAAMTTLDFERSGIGGIIKYERELARLTQAVRERSLTAAAARRASVRAEIAQRHIELAVLRNLALRTVSLQASGAIPNHEASVNFLFSAEFHQRLAATGMKALGPSGALLNGGSAPLDAIFGHDYLEASPHTILSGTSEIQRNVIATRGLGLPRE